jgi:Tfp pilus assembly protein PilX
MTIFGMTAIRLVNSEERNRSQYIRPKLSLPATESTLKAIEDLIEVKNRNLHWGCATVGSLMTCAAPASSSTPRWTDTTFTLGAMPYTVGSGTLAITPKYFVDI